MVGHDEQPVGKINVNNIEIFDTITMRGDIIAKSSENISELGSNNVTISNVAPAGVGTATISKWLIVKSTGGDTYYIPMWT